MNYYERALIEHSKAGGKIAVESKVSLDTLDDLSTFYNPGVASPCMRITEEPLNVYKYTSKANMIAVVSDGSAVLGLGNIGASASIPVMEGKCILFKKFGGIDAFPICIESQDTQTIIDTIKQISPVFGGINLEDIESPKCAEIERALVKDLDIPVFHDDQHGTAIVVSAALSNALKATGRSEIPKDEIDICLCGAGSAGLATASFLADSGFTNITLVEKDGILTSDSKLNWYQADVLKKLSSSKRGGLEEAIRDADVFIGLSTGDTLSKELASTMKEKSIIFALANPEPEIKLEDALSAGAAIVATGRSDRQNQINNLLVYPGLFRGALQSRSKITHEMKLAALNTIAGMVSDASIYSGIILPSVTDMKLHEKVAEAVYMASLTK